jgi:hypothetical protein
MAAPTDGGGDPVKPFVSRSAPVLLRLLFEQRTREAPLPPKGRPRSTVPPWPGCRGAWFHAGSFVNCPQRARDATYRVGSRPGGPLWARRFLKNRDTAGSARPHQTRAGGPAAPRVRNHVHAATIWNGRSRLRRT